MNEVFKYKKIEKLKDYIGKTAYERQFSYSHLCEAVGEKAYLLIFDKYNIKDASKKDDRTVIYCDENDFIMWSDTMRLPNTEKGLPSPESFKMLAIVFEMLTKDDIDILDKIEDDLSALEEELITSEKMKKGTDLQIIIHRRALLKLKRYYEQISAIADILALDEAGIIPKALNSRFIALSHKIDRLESTVAHLREYVTQVREAYQAQIDIEQNQIMKIFTVLTAVFSPLSLIAGWYGMNIIMPEYKWTFGYPYVIVLSIVICCLTYWFFLHKKWF